MLNADQINTVIGLFYKIDPAAPDSGKTITNGEIRAAALEFINALKPPRWQKIGKRWVFKPNPRSKELWELTHHNDKLGDISTRAQSAVRQSLRLEDFAFAYAENVYLHRPSGIVLRTHQLNNLFPEQTWPWLNGERRKPSAFIRRFERFTYLHQYYAVRRQRGTSNEQRAENS